jgi:hypothetical protein
MRPYRHLFLITFLVLLFAGLGCETDCGDSCSDDSDCSGSLVCYSSQCAPKKCRTECSSDYVNMCYFDRVSCTYISCD